MMKNILCPLSPRMDNLRTHAAFPWRSAGASGIALAVWLSATLVLGEENSELSRAVQLTTQVVEMYKSGRYGDAIPLAKEALAINEKASGPEHPDRAASLHILGVLYVSTGDYAKAEPLLERALAIREKALGSEHPETARSLNNLAELYRATSNYAKAEPLCERALAIREKVLGPKHPDTAKSLNSLAALYNTTGNYAKAEPLVERALAIRERALGPEHPAMAESLNNLATLYQTMGKYAKAEPLYERALAISEKALGSEHPITATSLDNLAMLYKTMGNSAKAESLFERALAIREKALGSGHPDAARSLNNLAALYQTTGNYAKAEPLFERALAIREKALGLEHPDVAESLNDLAWHYQTLNDYVKAERLYQRALAISEKALAAEHSDTANYLNNLARLYQIMGNYSKAEPLFERALAIKKKTLGSEHLDTAASFNDLATLYLSAGNYSKAEPLFERALAIREKGLGPESPITATSLNDLAMLYQTMGSYSKAEPLYERALAISEKALGSEHQDTATNLNNLANLYLSMRNYAKAEPLYARALVIRENAAGMGQREMAASLTNLARLYEFMGNYAKAEPLFERALAISEKLFGSEHPDTAIHLNNLACLYFANRNYAKAEPLFERALAIREKALGSEHPETAGSLHNLAFLHLEKEEPAETLMLASRAGQMSERTLANVLSFSSEQQRSEFQKKQIPYVLPATLGDAPLIARTLLHWKGVVLDSVIEDRAVAKAAGEKGLCEQIETMKSLQAQLFKLTLEAPKDTSETALRSRAQQRDKLGSEVERMEAALARNVAALGQSRRALEVTPGQVQAALRSQEALVEFIRYTHYLGKGQWETRYGAVIFVPKGALQWVALGAAEDTEKTIRLYQKSARGKTDETTLQTTLRGLHEKIWAAIEKALPRDTKSVILCPDSELNFVSFATLLGEDDRFLAEKYSLRYVSSGRDLLLAPPKEASSTQKRIAAYGNPDFRLARTGTPRPAAQSRGPLMTMREAEIRDFQGIKLAPLAGTAAECKALAELADKAGGQVEIKTGAEATEAALQEVKSPRVLHLATHGFFLPEIELGDSAPGIRPLREIPKGKLVNPMHRSGLALAGAQTTLDAWGRGEVPAAENDGILTAEEVGTLPLAGTWLVTLSACETGTGQARAGEGVLGLRRGFIQAGAQNLLMTLWPISDETTVQIMLDFYGSAFASGDAPKSLIEVQRKWLVKLRKEKGLLHAVQHAGPFIMSSQGRQ
jgi:tetratricopeptide (TPR) repeat protein